jgi:hypothetical protein
VTYSKLKPRVGADRGGDLVQSVQVEPEALLVWVVLHSLVGVEAAWTVALMVVAGAVAVACG